MRFFLLFSIVNVVLSAPILDYSKDNLDPFNDQGTLEDDMYNDQDYGEDSESVEYDDESDVNSGLVNLPVLYNLMACGSENLLSISSLEMIPDPPKTGQNLTLIASGILRAPVEEGSTLRVTVKLGFFTLYDHTDKVCDLTRANGLDCPIGRGQHSLAAQFPIPGIAPKKEYKVLVEAKNPDGAEILCLTGSLLLTL